MSASDDFNDAQATRATRRTNDEKLLNGWYESHPQLAGFLKSVVELKTQGFTLSTLSGFIPNVDTGKGDYVAPVLAHTITFQCVERTSAASLRLDVNGAYKFEAEGTSFEGTGKGKLLAALTQWVEGLNAEFPAHNITAHIKRAQTAPKSAAKPDSKAA